MANVEIDRDRYGRPLVVPPNGGKPVAYTRATTIANSLDDASALTAWKMRMAAIGLTTRPDILLSITAAQEDKLAVNSLIEDAMQVAGANKAANIGTAIHSFAEQLDLGHDLGVVPPEWMPDVKAYEQATKDFDKKELQEWLDNFSVRPVFTAHPTEAARRSVLSKMTTIAQLLEQPDSPTKSERLAETIDLLDVR